MSKSKSRHSSRQAVAARKSGSSGVASRPLTTTAEDVEQDQETLTDSAVAESEEATVSEEVSTSKTSSASAEKAASDKAAPKKAATGEVAKKETAAAKTVKAGASSGKTAPVKTAARAVPNTPRSVPNTPAFRAEGRQSRDAAKYERRIQERQSRYLAERRRRRNRALTVVSVLLVVALLVAGGYFFVYRPYFSGAAPAKAAQGTYQEAIYNTNYPPVDSVYCDQLEQSVEHIHVYVAIYINGTASQLPAGIGIPQDSSGNTTCYYWLHTHDTSGVVHIESPSTETFTFGQFRDEWDQQFVSLGFPPELLLKTGWTIWVDGQPYHGSLDSVPFNAHNIITLAYNSPKAKPVTTYNWNGL